MKKVFDQNGHNFSFYLFILQILTCQTLIILNINFIIYCIYNYKLHTIMPDNNTYYFRKILI
jgi:hypothetical protein